MVGAAMRRQRGPKPEGGSSPFKDPSALVALLIDPQRAASQPLGGACETMQEPGV